MTMIGKNTRVTGEARTRMAAELAERYGRGESIRAMANDLGRSYGWVQGLLKEAGVTLRTRGGATRGPAGQQRAQVAWAGRTAGETSTAPAAPVMPTPTVEASTSPVVTTIDVAPAVTVEPEPDAPSATAVKPKKDRKTGKSDKDRTATSGKDGKSDKDKKGKKGKSEKVEKSEKDRKSSKKAKDAAKAKAKNAAKGSKKHKGSSKGGPVAADALAEGLFRRTDGLADEPATHPRRKQKGTGR